MPPRIARTFLLVALELKFTLGWLSGWEARRDRVDTEAVRDVLSAVDGTDLLRGAGTKRIRGGSVSHANCTPA